MHDDETAEDRDFLDEVEEDLIEFEEKHWPRSQQVETGGSGLFGCRAEAVLRLNEVPETDQDWSWEAFVGHAIDERLGAQRKVLHPELLVQERVVYRGVPFTLDEYSPHTFVLNDWKSVDNGEAAKQAAAKPGDKRIAQVMGGAAALIELGYRVDTVRLTFVPRSGPLRDPLTGQKRGAVWEAPFDREWADAGVEWAFHVIELAGKLRPDLLLADGQVDRDVLKPLRDEFPSFCWTYCPFVTACRGPSGSSDTEAPSEEALDAGHRYLQAWLDKREVEARFDYWKDTLRHSGPIILDGWKLAWTKDGREWAEQRDTSKMDPDAYEAYVEPLPVKRVMTGKAPFLTPRRIQPPKPPKKRKKGDPT